MANEITAARTTFTADGKSADGYLAQPVVAERGPALILIQEWWGLNKHIEDVAQRYARAGYIVAAVDLYDGKVTQDAGEAGKLMSSLDPQQALAKLSE